MKPSGDVGSVTFTDDECRCLILLLGAVRALPQLPVRAERYVAILRKLGIERPEQYLRANERVEAGEPPARFEVGDRVRRYAVGEYMVGTIASDVFYDLTVLVRWDHQPETTSRYDARRLEAVPA